VRIPQEVLVVVVVDPAVAERRGEHGHRERGQRQRDDEIGSETEPREWARA